MGADCFDSFIRVNRDAKCVAACMLSPPYLDSGDGAQKLENHIGIPQLQLVGVIRVSGHAALWQQKVKHDTEVTGRAANF